MKKFYLFSLTLVSLGIATNLSSETLSEMEARIGQMGVVELQDRRAYLLQEQEGTQNPSRLKEIADELSAVQKALVALVGAAVISNVTDDGYNDNVPPVITLNGSNPDSVELGNTYSDPGATAFDEFHGETPVSASSNVDTSTVGSYTITYTATDLDGNTATATRTVNVVDTTAPVVTVTGDNPATVELGGTYTDAGATATDASGAVTVVTSGDTVDPDTLGTYTITYTSTDASGNSGTASRTVNVVDSTAPVFTSSSTFVVDEGATAVGTATATDIQSVTFSISGSVLAITSDGVITFIQPADYEGSYITDDPSTLAYGGELVEFTATVTATDASSNAATQIITVSIRDADGIDDNPATGTSTGTTTTGTYLDTDTATGTGTDTSTSTGTGTGTGTGTDTSTGTGTSSGTST